MGAGSQLGLVLWKNILLRKRQPFVLFVELLWPVVIFLVVVLVRRTSPPEEQHQCFYAPRAMPSSGYPFLQSFVCNLDNKCYPNESAASMPNDIGISSFLKAAQPMYDDTGKTSNMLKDLPKTRKVLDGLTESLNSPEIKKLLDMDPTISSFVKDPGTVRTYLIEEIKLSPPVVDSIMQSTINISKMYELTGNVDFKKIACSPGELQQYLMFSGEVPVATISQQLCNIAGDRISDTTDYLLTQIDVAKIIQFAADLKDAVGEYTDAEMLSDVALLMQLVSNSDTARMLLGEYPDIIQASQWVVSAVNFVNQLQDGMGLNINQLQSVIEGIEPMLSVFLANEEWYGQVKNAMGALFYAVDWLNAGTKSLYQMPIKFANVLYNKTELNMWMVSLNLTADVINEVLNAQINNDMLFKVVDQILKGGDMHQIMCSDPGFAAMFQHEGSSSMEKLRLVQTTICAQDLDEWNQELTHVFDMQYLLGQLEGIASGQLEFKGINWTNVYSSGLEMFNGINSLMQKIEPLLGDFSVEEMWNNLALSASGLLDMSDWETAAKQFAPLMGDIQGFLESSELWDSTLRQTLVAGDITMEMGITLYRKLGDLGPYLSKLLQEEEKFVQFVNDVIEADAQTVTTMIAAMTNQSNIEMLYRNINEIGSMMCDEKWLKEFLDPRGEAKLNMTTASNILCNSDTAYLLKKIINELDVSEIEDLSEDYQLLAEGKLDLGSPEMLARQNISALFSKSLLLVRLLSSINASTVDWADTKTHMGANAIDAARWSDIFDEIAMEFALSYAGVLIETYGEMLEQSSLWETLGPVVVSIDATLRTQIFTFETTIGMFTNGNEIGRMLHYISRYGPQLMNALSEMILNKEKTEKFAKLEDPVSELCNPFEIGYYLNVSSDVPLKEIQEYLCNLDVDKVVQEVMSYARLSNNFEVMEALQKLGRGEDFDWTEHFATLRGFINTMTLQIKGVDTAATTDFFNGVNYNSIATSFDKMMDTMTKVPIESLEAIMVIQTQLIDNVLPALGNQTDVDMVAYYIYHANEMMKSMNKMMERVVDDGLTLDVIVMNSTYLRNMISNQIAVLPDLMEAMSSVMMNPQKMMKALLAIDLEDNFLCNGLNFTDLMDFKETNTIQKYEKMICKLNTTVLMEEIMKQPMIQELTMTMEKIFMYEPSSVPKDYDINMIELMVNGQKMMAHVENLMSKNDLPVFPSVPGFNVTAMEQMMNKMLQNIQNLDINSLYKLMEQAAPLLPSLLTASDMSTDNALMELMMGGVYVQMASLKIATNLLMKVNGSEIVSITDLIDAPEMEKLFDVTKSLPDVMNVMMNGINYMLTNPEKLNSIGEDLMNLCGSQAVFEEYFPRPQGSQVDMVTVYNAVCQAVGINTTLLMEQLITGIDGMADMASFVNTLIGQQHDSAMMNQLNLTGLVYNVQKFETLLTQLIMNPPKGVDFGLPEEWMQPEKWESLVMNYTGQFENTWQYLQDNSMDVIGQTMMNQLLGQSLMSMQDTLDPQMKQLFSMMGYFTELLSAHLEPYVGKNVTLEYIFRDSPETTKIIQQVPHLPILLEVAVRTAVNKPFLATLQDVTRLCEHALYDVPAHASADFNSVLDQLCAVNYTTVETEMMQLLDIDPKILQGEMVDMAAHSWVFNLTAVGSHVQKLTELFTRLSATTRWTQDYSWLTDYNWEQMISSQFTSYVNATTMEILEQVQGTLMNDMFTQWVIDLQTMLSADDKNAIHMTSHVMGLVANHLKSYAGQNISLEYIFRNSSETMKIINQVPHLPVIVEVALKTVVSGSDKITSLASVGDLSRICTDPDRYFTIPQGVRTQFNSVLSTICAVNYTTVTHEMYELIGLATTDLDNYMNEIDASTAINITELVTSAEIISSVVAEISTTSRWTQDYTWLYQYDWNKLMEEVFDNYDTETSIDTITMQVTGALVNAMFSEALFGSEEILSEQVRASLWQVNHLVVGMDTLLQSYIGKNVSLEFIFRNSPETTKVVQEVPSVPLMLEVVMRTLLNKPQEITNLISGDPYRMCTETQKVFDIPMQQNPQKAVSFMTSITNLCAVNYTIVSEEVQGLLGVDLSMFSNSGDSVNISTLIGKIERFTRTLTALTETTKWTQDYSWLYNYQWGSLLDNILSSYTNQTLVDTFGMLAEPTISSMIQVFELLMEDGDLTTAMNKAGQMVSLMTTQIGSFEKNVTLSDIFEESPAMLRLIDQMDKIPTAIEVIIRSMLEQPQQLSAWMNGNLTRICLGEHEDILYIPDNLKTKLEELLYVMCTTNYDQLAAQLSTVFKVNNYMDIYNSGGNGGTLDVDGLVANVTILMNLFSELSAGDLVWATDYSSLMDWDWQTFFTDVTSGLDSWDTWNGKLPDIILALNATLGEVYPGWLTMVDSVVQMLEMVQGLYSSDPFGNYEGVDNLRNLILIEQKLPEIFEMLVLSAFDQEKFRPLQNMLTSDPESVCKVGNIEQYITLPATASFTVDWLKDALCNFNDTLIAKEGERLVDILQKPLAPILTQSTAEVNLTAMFTRVSRIERWFTEEIMAADPMSTIWLLSGSPQFNPALWEPVFTRLGQQAETLGTSQSIGAAISSAIQIFSSLAGNITTDTTGGMDLSSMVQVASVLSDYVNGIIGKLSLSSPDLELSNLFVGTEQWIELLDTMFNVAPDLISGLMNITIRPQKIYEVVSMSEQELTLTLCNAEQLEKLFVLPSTINKTAALSVLCQLQPTVLIQEFMSQFTIDKLIQDITNAVETKKPVDPDHLTSSIQEMMSNLENLMNVTSVHWRNVNLANMFNISVENVDMLPLIWQTLQAEATGMDVKPYASSIAEIMDTLEEILMGTDFWTDYKTIMMGANLFMQVALEKVNELPTANITLASVLKDEVKTREFLQKTFDLSPDLVSIIMSQSIDFAQLLQAQSPEQLRELYCGPDVEYANSGQKQSVDGLFCNTDFDAIYWELADSWNWPYISSQLQSEEVLNSANMTLNTTVWDRQFSLGVNYTEYILNVEALSTQLTHYFTHVQLPTLPQLMQYDGDYTTWLQRLEQAASVPTTTDSDTIKLLSNWLEAQSSNPDMAPIFNAIIPSFKAVNQLAEVLNGQIANLPVNFTLTDIFRDQPYIREYLSKIFADLPELVNSTLNGKINFAALGDVINGNPEQLQDLLCSDGLQVTTQAHEMLCSTNETLLLDELYSIINVEKIINELTQSYASMDVSPLAFNWTEYFHNLVQLQETFGEMLQNPTGVSLPDFFLYKGDFNSWLTKFSSVVMPSMSETEWLEMIQKTAFEAIKGVSHTFDSPEVRHVYAFVSTVMEWMNTELIKINNVGTITLDTLVGDTGELKKILHETLNLDEAVIDAFLMGTVQPQVFSALVSGNDAEIRRVLCEEPLKSVFVLSGNDSVSLESLRSSLCEINTTALMIEVQGQFSINALPQQLDIMISTPAEEVQGSLNEMLTKSDTFLGLLNGLISNPPSLDSSLENIFNFNWVEGFITRFVEEEAAMQISRMADGFLSTEAVPPELMAVFKLYEEVLSDIVKDMQQLKDEGWTFTQLLANPAKYAEWYYKFVTHSPVGNPKMFEHLTSNPAVAGVVCDERFYMGLDSTLPSYVNLTAIRLSICKQPITSWYNNLISAGIDEGWLSHINTQVNEWMNYTTLATPDTELAQQLQRFFQLVVDLEVIPAELSMWNNMTVMMQSISALFDPKALLLFASKEMQSYDYLGVFGGDDNVIRSGIFGIASALEYFNKQINTMQESGMAIDLGVLFPDVAQITDLLEQFLTPESAQVLLAASVNPEMIINLSDPKKFVDTVCDANLFREALNIADTVDLDELQKDLCKAATDSPHLVQQLISLVDVNAFFNTVVQLAEGGGIARNPFKLMSEQLDTFFDNMEWLTSASSNSSLGIEKMLENLGEFSEWLSQSPTSAEGSCSALKQVLDDTTGSLGLGSYLGQIQTYMELALTFMEALPDAQPLFCAMPGQNLTQLYENFSQSRLMGAVTELTDVLSGAIRPEFNCSAYMDLENRLTSAFESVIESWPAVFNNTLHCIAKSADQQIPALMEIDGIIKQLKDVNDLINDIPELADMGDMTQIISIFIEGLVQQRPLLMSLQDMMENSTSIEAYIGELAGAAPHLAEELLKSSVNVDLRYFLNLTDSEIENILCDPVRLGEMIELSPMLYLWDVSTADVSSWLCSGDIKETVMQFKSSIDVGNVFMNVVNAAPDYFLNSDWLSAIMSTVNKIVIDLDAVLQLSSALEDFDLTLLAQYLPKLQNFVESDGPDVVIDDIQELFVLLKSGISDETVGTFLDDLVVIADGIRGLKVLQTIPDTVHLSDMLKDPEDFHKYLMSLQLSPEVAESIMNSSITFELLLNMTNKNIPAMICEGDRLKTMLLVSSNSSASVQQISQELCALDDQTIIDLTTFMSAQISIGNFIQELLNFQPDLILANANVSKSDLKDIADNFSNMGDSFKQMLISLKNISATVDLSSITEKQTDTSTISGLSDLICGRGEAFNIQNSYGLNVGDEKEQGGTRKKRQTREYTLDDIDRLEMSLFSTKFCRDMYMDIVSSDDGRVIWAYLKPLLVGKIPFAPDNEMTRAIMTEAMGMFRDISKINELAKTMADSADEMGAFSQSANDTEILKRALENSFVSGSIRSMLGVDGQSLIDQLDALSSLSTKDAKQMKILAELAANVTRCVEIDRLEAYSSESQVEERAIQLARTNRVLAAIVFESEEYDSRREKRSTVSIAPHIKYKIRMDVDNTPSTKMLKDYWWKPGPGGSFVSDMRYLRGFLELQDMIDRAIIKLQTGEDTKLPEVDIQQMPHPCYERDSFHEYVSAYFLPIIMMLGWLMVLANSIRNLVYDREKGLEETMKMMGLKSGLNFVGWFLNTFLSMAVLSIIVSLLIKLGNLLGKTDFFVTLVFLLCFSFSTTMLGYMISAFFDRSTLAAFAGVIIYMISYLPFILVVATYASVSFTISVVINLSSTTAFSLGSQLLAYAEQRGTGGQWDNIDDLVFQNDWSFTWCMYMMLIDGLIYGIIGWYVRTVFPGKYGVAQPFYFPLSPRYWGCCSGSSRNSKYNMSQFGNQKFADEEDDTDLDPDGVKKTGFRSLQGVTKDGALKPSISAEARKLGPGEKDPDLPVGISLHKLKKVYKKGKKLAVDELTVNFFKGQITAFLGRNGAGKTTTINMLSGNFSPTSGIAFVNGREILADSSAIRRQLGVCPQNDILFEYMTVMEHLAFFSTLKSKASKKERKSEIYDMLSVTGLQESHNVRVSQLSGGQKRRLAVALAFIGGSEVVILDEPTSGVDPAARRSIWDLITAHREGRTIMLSTHHLDEADIIGDRIVVIHQGKLVCSGSPMFLKAEYGSGYHLTMAGETAKDDKPSTLNPRELLTFTKQHVPNARVVEELGSEVTMVLPTAEGGRAGFRSFFSELESRKHELGISHFGVSDTTLEEVFLKLTLYAERGETLNPEALRAWNLKTDFERESLNSETDSGVSSLRKGSTLTGSTNGNISDNLMEESLSGSSNVTGAALKWRQFWAILTKRFHHHRRDVRSYLSQIVLPIIFMIMAMAFTLVKPDNEHLPSLMMSPDLYGPDHNLFIRTDKPYMEENLKFADTLIHDPGVGTTCMKNSEMLDQCHDDFGEWDTVGIPADKMSLYEDPPPCECVDGWQQCPEGATGMPLPKMLTRGGNHLHNITASPFTTPEYLIRTFQQFEFDRSRYGGWELYAEDSASKATVWYNNKGFHVVPSFYNALNNMVLRANINSSVHGNPSKYGITTYNHPLSLSKEQLSETTFMQSLADTGIAMTILCAFCFVPAGYTIYLINERINREKRMQYICGVGIFMYWFAAIVWDLLSYMLTVGLASAVAAAFQINIYTSRLNLAAFSTSLLLFGWATIPLMYLWTNIYKEPSTGYMVTFIVNLMIGINTTACVFLLKVFSYASDIGKIAEILEKVFLIFPQFCLGDCLVRLSSNQLVADVYERFNVDKYKNPFSFEMLGWQFVAMGVQGLVFFLLHLVIEARPCETTSIGSKKSAVNHKEDSDVGLERQRVVTGEARNDLLQLHGMRKTFRRGLKKVVAVDSVTFGVPRGECFGLLGVNGAGKTTTFNMLTGEEIPSRGAAILNDKIISVSDPELKQKLGYCPQVDALDGFLTVKETLSIYSKMKGVPTRDINQVVTRAVGKLGLEAFLNKTVKTLSGGTKRKLSTALALIGDPDLVLLDEPTTGMDPQTRRLVWNNLIKLVKQHRSVIITSHSMAECDAVCTKMAIMVNGRLMCIGTSQHLKNKFGQGYTLTTRIAGKQAEVQAVKDYVLNGFAGSRVLDQHLNVVDFELSSSTTRLSDIFGRIEQSKDILKIQEYSVSQTTLDHVFINFAKKQTDGVIDEEDDVGYNNQGYDGVEGGRLTPSSYSNTTPKGSVKIMREENVRRSLEGIKHGVSNPAYDTTPEAEAQRLYPNLEQMSPQPVSNVYTSPPVHQVSPPQPVSVVNVGPEIEAPPHYSGGDIQSEPAAVSQITVGMETDSVAPPPPIIEAEAHISKVDVSGVTPPNSSTTSPELARREQDNMESFSSRM